MPEQSRDNERNCGSLGSGDTENVTMNAIIVNYQHEAAMKAGSISSVRTRQNLQLLSSDKSVLLGDKNVSDVMEVAGMKEKEQNQKIRGLASLMLPLDPYQGSVPSHIRITVAGCQEISKSTSALQIECTRSCNRVPCRSKFCAGLWTRVLRNRSTFCVVLMRQFRLFNRSIG